MENKRKFNKYLRYNTKRSEDYKILREQNYKNKKSLYSEEFNVCDKHIDGV